MKKYLLLLSAIVVFFAPEFAFGKEAKDPYAGRVVLGFSIGGYSSGSGPQGFLATVGVEYYFIKYVSSSFTTGYGMFGRDFTNTNDNSSKSTTVNLIPADIAVLGHILPGKTVNPYIGPGIGLNYMWWTIKNKQDDQVEYHIFGTAGATIQIAKGFAMNIGATYTVPYDQEKHQLAFDQYYLGYGVSGGIVF